MNYHICLMDSSNNVIKISNHGLGKDEAEKIKEVCIDALVKVGMSIAILEVNEYDPWAKKTEQDKCSVFLDKEKIGNAIGDVVRKSIK